MIDLRIAGLPRAIRCGSLLVPVVTSFRAWIAFDHGLKEDGAASRCIFPDGKGPDGDSWVEGALRFLASPNSTPRDTERSDAVAYDLVEDGEYIVSSFMQAYGIDLTDPSLDMHWHLFKALFAGLPADTKMMRIIGWRTWRKDTRKNETVMAALKAAWRLPDAADKEYIDLQQRLFGNVKI